MQAQPGGWLHVSVVAMQELPQAFPVMQTLQHDDDGPDELLHPNVRGGPLAAARVSTSAPATRPFLQIHRNLSMELPFSANTATLA